VNIDNPDSSKLTRQINSFTPGTDPGVQLIVGDIATAVVPTISSHLYSLGDLSTWVPMPDLGPGNMLQFIAESDNKPMELELMWSERRVPGNIPGVG